MLNVLTIPFLLSHSDSPIPLEVEAGILWQNYLHGASWGYWIIFAGNNVPFNTKIEFTLYGQVITVEMQPTGASIPDNGIYVEENTSLNIDDWLNTIFIPTVNQNYHINKCTFMVAGNFLFINAPYDSFLSVASDIPGAIVQLIGVGTPDIFPENYNIICDVYVTESGGVEKKVASLASVPEKQAPWKASFNLQNILAAFVKRELPSYNQNSISLCSNPICFARVEFAEGYGNPVQYQHLHNEQWWYQFIVIKGGVPFNDFPIAGLAYPFTASEHWFTWKPKSIIVSEKQPEYLYWFPIYSFLYPYATITAELRGRITYKDGTYQDVTYIAAYTFQRYSEYIIPAGYTQLNIANYAPSKEVDKWTVYLYAPSLPPLGAMLVSPIQTYILDIRCAEDRELFFLFGNSLNGFDTLRTTTNAQVGFKIDKEEFAPRIGWDYSSTQGQKKTFNIQTNKRVKVSTGWVSLEYIKYLQEFIISDEIFIIEAGKHIPVILLLQSVSLYTNNAQLYALEFEVEYATSANKFASPNLLHI